MKRWMWILGALLAFQLMEKTASDIEQLQPVQLLEVSRSRGEILLRTDTGDQGRGRNLEAAMKNMADTSEKRIFLETADQLLLRKNTEYMVPELYRLLRPAVRVCRVGQKVDLKQAAEFLSTHEPRNTLGKLYAGEGQLPELKVERGRLKLAGNH